MIKKIIFISSFKYLGLRVKRPVLGHDGNIKIVLKNFNKILIKIKIFGEFQASRGMKNSITIKGDFINNEIIDNFNHILIHYNKLPEIGYDYYDANLRIELMDNNNKILENKDVHIQFIDEDKASGIIINKVIIIITTLTFLAAVIFPVISLLNQWLC